MLKGILAISGQPGLFKVVSEGKNNIIVESLLNGKKMPAFASSKISSLEDIAIYTLQEDVPLKEVFKNIIEKENGGKAISHKASTEELTNYFAEVLPDYDRDQVYISDIRKVIQWYNLLQEKELLNDDDEENEEETESETSEDDTKE
ncbi:hypothetical protein PbJCM13498_36810 [Prolixibacter bellariivorans]|uniref:Uncharacterized protein n=1 Tax=Prolixibacter bellariivorans TaxID=314319 RepID=A0A5M4B4P8_9BACT|nr:DUF5606 domain-containing protein [Prolixibacter bellariivorans]GET34818.1 hypothetical protein PbJCM13498_36810 [Prolixibacter bellariivorans]